MTHQDYFDADKHTLRTWAAEGNTLAQHELARRARNRKSNTRQPALVERLRKQARTEPARTEQALLTLADLAQVAPEAHARIMRTPVRWEGDWAIQAGPVECENV